MPTLAEGWIEKNLLTNSRRNIVVLFEDSDLIWDEKELICLANMNRDGCSVTEMMNVFGRKDPDEIFLALFYLAKVGKVKKINLRRLIT